MNLQCAIESLDSLSFSTNFFKA